MNKTEIDSQIEGEISMDLEPQAEILGGFAEIGSMKNHPPTDGYIPLRN